MGKKDIRFIGVSLLLIGVLVCMLVHLIQKRREIPWKGDEVVQETPTPGVLDVHPDDPTYPAKENTKTTPAPTPTSLLSLGITPIVPGDEQDAVEGDGDSDRVHEGQAQWSENKPQMPVWSLDGVTDIGDLYALANFIGGAYSEQEGVGAIGMPVGAEEYDKFKNPCAYYVDRYGFLYVNVKVVLEDGTTRYLTCALGYYGNELAVYDIEEVN